MNDGAEILVYQTNATNNDTDDDGLNDSAEILVYQTNATNPDTDGEGLNDYEEIITHQTNATNPDTDGDGYNDKVEVDAGTDPKDPTSYPKTSKSPNYLAFILIGIQGEGDITEFFISPLGLVLLGCIIASVVTMILIIRKKKH